jgi:hypothetical protein
MIVTDKFVYLHQPKTGGTFVTSVLLRLHQVRWSLPLRVLSTRREDMVFHGRYGRFVYNNRKHGERRAIPPRHDRPRILATFRNPYDLLVSQYEFGWWKRKECLQYFRAVPRFSSKYPHFPALTFAEYVEISDLALQITTPDLVDASERPGLLTREFIRFYCKNPELVLSRFAEGDFSTKELRSELEPIHFLRQHSLNHDLHAFLLGVGYEPLDLDFIPTLNRILPGGKGRPVGRPWQAYYTAELQQSVRSRERLLFELFPEFECTPLGGV